MRNLHCKTGRTSYVDATACLASAHLVVRTEVRLGPASLRTSPRHSTVFDSSRDYDCCAVSVMMQLRRAAHGRISGGCGLSCMTLLAEVLARQPTIPSSTIVLPKAVCRGSCVATFTTPAGTQWHVPATRGWLRLPSLLGAARRRATHSLRRLCQTRPLRVTHWSPHRARPYDRCTTAARCPARSPR